MVLLPADLVMVEKVVIGVEVVSFELVKFGALVVVLPYFLVIRVDVIALFAVQFTRTETAKFNIRLVESMCS